MAEIDAEDEIKVRKPCKTKFIKKKKSKKFVGDSLINYDFSETSEKK